MAIACDYNHNKRDDQVNKRLGLAVKACGYNINALNAHLGSDGRHFSGDTEILVKINEMLAEKHQISYTTIQTECMRLDDCGGVLRDLKDQGRRYS